MISEAVITKGKLFHTVLCGISAITRRVPTTPRRLFVTSYRCQWIHRPIDDPPEIVLCVVCDKKILTKFTKKKHMKTHTSGDKTPNCNICEKVLKKMKIQTDEDDEFKDERVLEAVDTKNKF